MLVPFEFILAPILVKKDEVIVRRLFKHCLFIVHFMDDSLRHDDFFVEELMSCGCMRSFITEKLSFDVIKLPLLKRPKKRYKGDHDYFVQSFLCGSVGSGKSTFLQQLQKTMTSLDQSSILKKRVKMQFVECPTDNEQLFKLLFQCHVMIVMIDVTQEESYEFGKYWIHLAWIHEIPVIVALNKIDLTHDKPLLNKMRKEFQDMGVLRVVAIICLKAKTIETICNVLVNDCTVSKVTEKRTVSQMAEKILSMTSSVDIVDPLKFEVKRLVVDSTHGFRITSSASVLLSSDCLSISFKELQRRIFQKVLVSVTHQYPFAMKNTNSWTMDIDWNTYICQFQSRNHVDYLLFRQDDLESFCAQLKSSLTKFKVDENLFIEALSGSSSMLPADKLIVRLASFFSVDQWRKKIDSFHAHDLYEHQCLHLLQKLASSPIYVDGAILFGDTHCISFRMMELICDGLRCCPNINSVSFVDCQVDRKGLEYFLEQLKSNLFVESLKLVGIIDESLFRPLCDMIRSNQSIYSLCLKRCKFPKSMEMFFSSWAEHRRLKEIDFRNCGLGSHFAGLVVKRMPDIRFRTLHLSGNSIPEHLKHHIQFQCQQSRRRVFFGDGNEQNVVSSILDVFWIDFKDIKVESQVGKGGQATVHRGDWNDGVVALRELRLESSKSSQELAFVSSLQHPCIVKCFGITRQPNQRFYYQVMELKEGDLRQLLNRNNLSDDVKLQMDPSKRVTLTEMDKIRMMLDVCRGMVYSHGLDIYHNDLKPENILYDRVDDSYRCCITDFGLSEENPAHQTQTLTVFRGTPAYSPPEMHRNHKMSPKGDVYSFGIMLYEVYFNRKPFQSVMPNLIPTEVINGERPKIPKITNQRHYKVITALIGLCWHKNTLSRPNFNEIEIVLSSLYE